jgi:hypothetical protein
VLRDFQRFRGSPRSCVIFYNMLLPVWKLFDNSFSNEAGKTTRHQVCPAAQSLYSQITWISWGNAVSSLRNPEFYFDASQTQLPLHGLVTWFHVSPLWCTNRRCKQFGFHSHCHSKNASFSFTNYTSSLNIKIIYNFTRNTSKVQYVSTSPRLSPGSSLYRSGRKTWRFWSYNKMKSIPSFYVSLLLKLSLSQSILITIFTSWI